MTYDIAVVGFGPAGVGAAIHAVFSNFKAVIFSGGGKEKKRARSTWVHEFQNVPGLSDTPWREIEKAERARLEEKFSDTATFVNQTVVGIGRSDDGGNFSLVTENEERFRAHFVILALGDTDVQPEIGGSIGAIFPYTRGLKGKSPSVHYCLRCDGHEVHGRDFAVIGYSEGAAAVAEYLASRSLIYDGSILSGNFHVKKRPRSHLLLHGEKPSMGGDGLKKLESMGFEIHPEPIMEVLGEPKKAELHGFHLEGGGKIEVSVAFVSLGMMGQNVLQPSLKELGVTFNDSNEIRVNEKSETATTGVFALGDGVEGKPRQLPSHWNDGYGVVREIEGRVRDRRLNALVSSCSGNS